MTDTDLLQDLLDAESGVWQALASGDAAADRAALAPGFLGVYPSGFSDRAGHVGQLDHGPTVVSWEIEAPRVMSLGPDLALLAYRARFTRPGDDSPHHWYVSSLWQRAGQGWQNLFSQDTPAR